uniref:Uncharacterized protein n=1 Tax=Schistocephalus solidus TaxID=70667 RepID=A0A0X3PNW2_SCHSO
MANRMSMLFEIWLLFVALASAEWGLVALHQDVMMYSNYEFVAFVPVSSRVSSQWKGAQGTSEHPCAAPYQCVEFYPHRASFRITGKPKNMHAALILTSENPKLPAIAITMVQGDLWLPVIPGVQFTRIINFDEDISESRILAFDEDIKDIMFFGGITTLSESAPENYMKLEVPNDKINKIDRKLMRVTGRMQNRYQAISVGNYGPGETTFTFVPSKTAGILRNPSQFLNWPMRSIGG